MLRSVASVCGSGPGVEKESVFALPFIRELDAVEGRFCSLIGMLQTAARLKGLISLGSGTIFSGSGHWEMSFQPHDTFHAGNVASAAVAQMPCSLAI